jgi:cobalt-zinc-cadmium efflux system membrane fusion protein
MARNTKRIRDLDEKLFANDALARTDLDQARTDEAAAIADRDAAAQQLRSIGIEEATIAAIHDGKQAATIEGAIRAPIPGTVVEKFITPGQLLAAGSTVAFNIADLSSMWVLASIYGSDVAAVRAGVSAEILTDVSAAPVTGHVDFVAPIVDPGTRATTVRILASNPNQLLKRDMFVRVRIRAARDRAGIVLPATSVLRDDDNLPFVFIANDDKSFSRRRITLGTAVDGGYEIVDGVKAGERVLANGALFVQFAEHQ